MHLAVRVDGDEGWGIGAAVGTVRVGVDLTVSGDGDAGRTEHPGDARQRVEMEGHDA